MIDSSTSPEFVAPDSIDLLTLDLAVIGRQLAAGSELDPVAARTAVLAGVLHALPAISRTSLTNRAAPDRRPTTLAASDDTALSLDTVQYGLGDGPCLTAVAQLISIRSLDLAAEERWPSFARAALTRTPVRSVISCSLADGGHAGTSLNLYVDRPITETDPDHGRIAAVAAACALALTAIEQRHRADHLDKALSNSRQIGMAMGILMSSQHLSADQAFDALRVSSQHSHRKLRDVAEDVLLTGALPEGRLPWHSAGS